jgi:hypothetical protein
MKALLFVTPSWFNGMFMCYADTNCCVSKCSHVVSKFFPHSERPGFKTSQFGKFAFRNIGENSFCTNIFVSGHVRQCRAVIPHYKLGEWKVYERRICTKAIKSVRIFSDLPQEQARLLTVGSIEIREPTCRNIAPGDLGFGASVSFGLWTWLHRCRFSPRKNKGLCFVFMSAGWEGGWNSQTLSANRGDNVLLQRIVYEWAEMFQNGRTILTDTERLGLPSISTSDDKQDQDRAMILDDRRTTIIDIATRLVISQGSAHSIVHDILGYHTVCARWVPNSL